MPELPEVETLRRGLAAAVVGKTIKSAEVDWHKMVKPLSIDEFQNKIKGKKILSVSRRAKMLILELSGKEFLIFHLKLTGQLIYRLKFIPSAFARASASPPYEGGDKIVMGGHPLPLRSSEASPLRLGSSEASPQKGGSDGLPNKFTHGILNFKDGSKLFFNDLRKFGWMRLVDKAHIDKVSDEHGIEPLSPEFTLKNFTAIIKKYPKRNIKLILMDQKNIAGVGNIYADESLFCTAILPTTLAINLNQEKIKKLFQCLKKILKLAIAKGGTSSDTYVQLNGQPGGFVPYLKVYGRKGKKCKRCGGTIKRIKLNGRGTHFCDQCQK